MVSLQYELLNVCPNKMLRQTTLYTVGSYGASHQCGLLYVSASHENHWSFLYTGSTQMISHQYELLNVSARRQTFQSF
jgi:hypothetical protein